MNLYATWAETSVRVLLRLLVVMFVFALPAAATATASLVFDSILVVEIELETESGFEGIEECLSTERVRRVRHGSGHVANCSSPASYATYRRQLTRIVMGHRLANGLLAPLTC